MDEHPRLQESELAQARQNRRQRTLALVARDLVHDFRNTLGALVALVDIAGRDSEAALDERLVARSRESLDRGIRMLDLVTRHAFRQSDETEARAVGDIISDLALMLESFARRRGMTLETLCESERRVAIDQRAVRDVLVRIALHGIATCEEGAAIRLAAVDSRSEDVGSMVALQLEFDGSPEPDASVRQLLEQDLGSFEPTDDFTQALADARLSLAISGGELRYEYRDGKRTFLFELPPAPEVLES